MFHGSVIGAILYGITDGIVNRAVDCTIDRGNDGGNFDFLVCNSQQPKIGKEMLGVN